MKSMTAGLLCISLTPSLLLADSNETLETTTITATSQNIVSNKEEAIRRISLTPGGASIVTSENWTDPFVNYEEIFQFEPGVYARSSVNTHDSRISIRGSGLQRVYGARGISMLINGMPANNADGSFDFRLVDPLSIDYIEVYRGANGLPYGGAQLGGAIDVIQKTGISAPGTNLTLQYGSFDSYSAALQYGGSEGDWDWFASYSYNETDGYIPHSGNQAHYISANLGYTWSDIAQTRFYFNFNDTDADLSGPLTKQQFEDDPRQQVKFGAEDYDVSTYRFGQNTSWLTQNGRWNFSANYQYVDFDHLNVLAGSIFPGFPSIDNHSDFDSDQFSVNLRGHENYTLFGLDHIVRTNLDFVYGESEISGSNGFAGIVNDRLETARNVNLYLENQTMLYDAHSIIYGVGYADSYRESEFRANDTTPVPNPYQDTQNGVTWRAGYLFEQSERTQVYANISRSFEAAPFSEVTADGISNPQLATTYEIGSRFGHKWFQGELTFYLADIQDEFIYEESVPGSGVYDKLTNADTIHQGIEFAAQVDVRQAFGLNLQQAITWDLAYQLNDFTFNEGPADGNHMPTVPENVISSMLTLAGQDQNWRTSLSVDWIPNDIYASNDNKLAADGYAIFDLYGEYSFTDKLTVYAGVDNLFDEDYAATVITAQNSATDPAYISPGSGRAAYIGATYSW
ncbi:TonB-dependent receptor family protein [Rubritalea spongiae]|uniref:TonB-dependent receptor family protein n=1 Tax=Rubritalea spongiae TaxID=430797 RepID=A0ABW5E7W7_9BACT